MKTHYYAGEDSFREALGSPTALDFFADSDFFKNECSSTLTIGAHKREITADNVISQIKDPRASLLKLWQFAKESSNLCFLTHFQPLANAAKSLYNPWTQHL